MLRRDRSLDTQLPSILGCPMASRLRLVEYYALSGFDEPRRTTHFVLSAFSFSICSHLRVKQVWLTVEKGRQTTVASTHVNVVNVLKLLIIVLVLRPRQGSLGFEKRLEMSRGFLLSFEEGLRKGWP
jgi:hypothetical protein